jgi:hypothetical protein
MSSIQDLNGEWEFLYDSSDEGIDNRWYAIKPEATEVLSVPHIWEDNFNKPASSVGFYFKTFEISKEENTKRLFLKFERSSYHTTVWLNGKILGENFGSYQPFEFDAGKAAKPGEENLLAVRVESGDSYGKIHGQSIDELPVGDAWLKNRFSGLWGGVSLISGGRACLMAMNVTPDCDAEKATVELTFNNPRNYQAMVRILITNPKGETADMVKEFKLEKENATHRMLIGFKDLMLWTPESPNLYTMEVYLDKSYGVTKRFGFRKFDCLRGDFYLNDRIYKIQGLRYTPSHPSLRLLEASPEAIRKDLHEVRKLGFSVIRSGGAPLTNIALDICDEIGLMVFQELPINEQKSTKDGLELVKTIAETLVTDQKTHPSIVAWVLGSENGTMMLENGTKLLKHLDQFDKCRPIFSNLNSVYLDSEGQYHKDTGKLMGVTNAKVLIYPSHRMNLKMNVSKSLCSFLSDYGNKEVQDAEIPDPNLGDELFQDNYDKFVKEISGKINVNLSNPYLYPDFKSALARYAKGKNLSNYKVLNGIKTQLETFIKSPLSGGLWSTLEDFVTEANQASLKFSLDKINAIQSNPLVSSFFLDQWADESHNLKGLCTEFRDNKGTQEFAREIALSTRLIIHGLDRTAFPDSKIDFKISLLNEQRLDSPELTFRLIDAKGKVINTQKKKAKAKTSLSHLGDFSIPAPSSAGRFYLEAEIKSGSEVLHTLTEPIQVLSVVDVDATQQIVCILDSVDTSSEALRLIEGKENIIATASLSSWSDPVLKALADAVKNGKTLLIDSLDQDDMNAWNESGYFGTDIESHYTSGANGVNHHFLYPTPVFKDLDARILDSVYSSVIPSLSLQPVEGAEILAGSVGFKNEEFNTGADLQIIKNEKGKIVISQFAIMENLGDIAIADYLWVKLINLIK